MRHPFSLALVLTVALLATILPAAGADAAFRFPKVGDDLATKPSIGKARSAAPDRLRAKDVVKGTGRRARRGDVVTTQYVGVLYGSGRQFDASWGAGAPFSFPLGAGDVIRGWDRGIRGMRVGGRRILVLPPRLAYGRAGAPPTIPPRATLTFVVDLVRVTR